MQKKRHFCIKWPKANFTKIFSFKIPKWFSQPYTLKKWSHIVSQKRQRMRNKWLRNFSATFTSFCDILNNHVDEHPRSGSFPFFASHEILEKKEIFAATKCGNTMLTKCSNHKTKILFSKTQCGNFIIFFSRRFYVKSILRILKVLNQPF